MESGKRIVNVLAIDGGGLRGVIPAILLEALAQRLDGPLYRHFDLIAGTSTGALIALGLSCRLQGGEPLTASAMLDVYVKDGTQIFPQHWWNFFRGLIWPKYSAAGLERVLRGLLQEGTLRDALTPVLVASYDLGRQVPYFFKSECARADSRQDWPLVSVARATSAAPTYLPGFRTVGPDGQRYIFVDGGVGANNPVMAAYAEAARMFPEAEAIHLVSVGTGNARNDLQPQKAIHWGLVPWARRMVSVMMDGVSEADDYEAKWLSGRRRDRFWRLQPELKTNESAMDNPGTIPQLCATARAYATQQTAVLDEIAAAIGGADAGGSATA